MRWTLLALLVAVACAACPPAVEPGPFDASGDYPAPPDFVVEEHAEDSPAGLASPCGRACENLRVIGCSDGYPHKGVTCYRGCLSAAKHQRLPTRCWIDARSIDGARACGGLRCRPR